MAKLRPYMAAVAALMAGKDKWLSVALYEELLILFDRSWSCLCIRCELPASPQAFGVACRPLVRRSDPH